MRKSQRDIVKLTSKEVLLSLFDIPIELLMCFERGRVKIGLKKYLEERSVDRNEFRERIYRLKKKGLIEVFVENKEKYIELTKSGATILAWDKIDFDSITRPERWDGKFRIIIFDIPEKDHLKRDILRKKIEQIGFVQIQKSVFVFPFECKELIDLICYYCPVRQFIIYMIAEIIEGEQEIIEKFVDKQVLSNSDLVK